MKIPKPILERRRSLRVSEPLTFKLGHEGYELQSESLNIGERGALCRLSSDIPMMTRLKIGVQIPPFKKGARGKKLTFKGVVVRKDYDPVSKNYLIAIYFQDVRSADARILREFIESRLNA